MPSSVLTKSPARTTEGVFCSGKESEQRAVPAADQLASGQRADRAVPGQLGAVVGHRALGQRHLVPVALEQGVVDVVSHRQGQVGRQRPRGGGPHPQRQRRFTFQLKLDGDRRVLPIAIGVVLAGLKVGKRCLALPAVGQDPVALVQQPFLPQLFDGPHDAFHVGQVHRLVVVVEVDPAGLAGDVALPLMGVAQHRRAAVVVEAVDAELGDGAPARHAELLLCFGLGRQAMAVPTETPFHPASPHGLVAGYGVLDEAGEQVAVVGQSIGERGPVVEDVLIGTVGAGRALADRGLERAVGRPRRQNLLLQFGQGRRGWDIRVRVLRHATKISGRAKVPVGNAEAGRGVRTAARAKLGLNSSCYGPRLLTNYLTGQTCRKRRNPLKRRATPYLALGRTSSRRLAPLMSSPRSRPSRPGLPNRPSQQVRPSRPNAPARRPR